jgi:lipoprotein-anchoring transpeptidase ErfK/SrfK
MRLFRPAALLVLALCACTDPALMPQGLTPAVQSAGPLAPDLIYAARDDNGITIPALPVAAIPAEFQRQLVDFPTEEAANTIIIAPGERHLYLVMGNGKALRYGIAVGRDGFLWSGEAVIANRKPWPTWTPPPEMIARKPELAEWKNGQPGGPTNPLGARALYLETNGVDYGYRIHGTPEWQSIGQNASSGCIRMINQDVMDLYERVPDGSRVIVLTLDGRIPDGLNIPPVQKPRQPAPPPPVVIPVHVGAGTPI